MSRNRMRLLALVGAGVLGGAGPAAASPENPVTGAPALQARAAAVQYVAGSAGTVELDSEHGATFDVEVHRPGQPVVDVWLDAAFRPVAWAADPEARPARRIVCERTAAARDRAGRDDARARTRRVVCHPVKHRALVVKRVALRHPPADVRDRRHRRSGHASTRRPA